MMNILGIIGLLAPVLLLIGYFVVMRARENAQRAPEPGSGPPPIVEIVTEATP